MNKKNKILLVDDDFDTRDIYAEVFKNAGFEVLTADDGVQGLDVATKQIPDVIFTGIIMPRMDGFGLIDALKKNVPTSNIPVFISSHMGRQEDKDKAASLGVRGFIIRGMTPPNEVVAQVNAIFVKGEYSLAFDPYSFDAAKLARDLDISNFQCHECNEKMVIRIQLDDPETKIFRARFVCPKCGWLLK